MLLEGDDIILRELEPADADALAAIADDPEVCRYLPTFLAERTAASREEAIEQMRAGDYRTGGSTFLAICPKDDRGRMVGLAEIYDFVPEKPKVSIGGRLARACWSKGYGSQAVELLKRHLIDDAGMRTITAHVMVENVASARTMESCGFRPLYTNLLEDWGFDEPVLISKYVYKSRWE